MNVTGYVVRFCNDETCSHDSEDMCPNPPSSVYYIDPDLNMKIGGTPLVVTHNQDFVVGSCQLQCKTGKGILLRCVIDDAYFLESLRRRFENYKENYNPDIPNFETFCKKTLSSFSLSHCGSTKAVRHVSLVDTPGRKGTAVDYVADPSVVLKRRQQNQHISDVIASHSSAYLTVADRRNYLLKNTSLSYNPGDLCYINASRTMEYQDEFKKAKEIYRILKAIREDTSDTKSTQGSIKRTRKTEDDGCDADENDGLECNNNKRRRVDDGDYTCQSAAPLPRQQQQQQSPEIMVNAMRDGIQQGIQAAMEMFKQQQQQLTMQHTPIPPTPAPLREVPVEAAASLIMPPPAAPPAVVEASRSRTTTITLSPDQEALDIIVNHVTGK
jgi:hypothetical protein